MRWDLLISGQVQIYRLAREVCRIGLQAFYMNETLRDGSNPMSGLNQFEKQLLRTRLNHPYRSFIF
jgi:hypothetical protein